jgi:hypothetical protein
VGKTFLIREFFLKKTCIFFNASGAKDAPMKEQIQNFTDQMGRVFYGGASLTAGKNWNETFKALTAAIENTPLNKKILLFLDEVPWMATKNARFLQNLDYYWNQHWSRNSRIKLIICGSSASWIIKNIVNNRGGLHNRLTHNIYLEPFTLNQTKALLSSMSVLLNHRQLVQLYMAIGGIPYYLSKIESGLSATQIIEKLAFKRNSFLMNEFNNLFASLFSDADDLINIMRFIASHRYGVGQEALLNQLGKTFKGKKGLDKLTTLQDTGFIMNFIPHFHASKGIYYKVIDEYSLFYFYWIEPIQNTLLRHGFVDGYWNKLQTTPAWHAWAGLTFEAVCYEHIPQISRALGLSPTAIPNTWRYMPREEKNEEGTQIDMLFDRDDDAITLCEIKYSDKPFEITKEYSHKLKKKIEIFQRVTRTKKQIFFAMISANGLKENKYAREIITGGTVTLNDLFEQG